MLNSAVTRPNKTQDRENRAKSYTELSTGHFSWLDGAAVSASGWGSLGLRFQKSEVLTRPHPTPPAKSLQNRDPTRPDPRVHPTRGQLWSNIIQWQIISLYIVQEYIEGPKVQINNFVFKIMLIFGLIECLFWKTFYNVSILKQFLIFKVQWFWVGFIGNII